MMKLSRSIKEHLDFDEYLEALASAEPVPGGGSAAAVSGALGSALTAMAASLTLKKAAEGDKIKAELNELVKRSTLALGLFRSYMVADSEAYTSVLNAYRMPKGTDAEKSARDESIQHALVHAAEIPSKVMELALLVLASSRLIVENCPPYCISDIGVAVHALSAAIAGARLNVEINLKNIKDEKLKKDLREKIQKNQMVASEQVAELQGIISERLQ